MKPRLRRLKEKSRAVGVSQLANSNQSANLRQPDAGQEASQAVEDEEVSDDFSASWTWTSQSRT